MHRTELNKYKPKVINYKRARRKLVGWSAIFIFITYIGTQLISGFVAGAGLAIFFGIKEQEKLQLVLKEFTLHILIFSLLTSALIMILLSLKFGKGLIKDRTPTGIALNAGGISNVFFGTFLGILIALLYTSIALFIFPPATQQEVGPITELLLTPGNTRIFWIFMALIFAPPVEEFLFRGVILAGLTYSRGVVFGSIITTILFISIHTFEAIHYLPAFIGISLIAIATLYLRLKYRALGPCVGAHFGYNLIIALGAILMSQ
ncbi:MAG: CPBP family intramembrane metalloprotease [Candidatus Dadabacteria bacterium]|nr:CPBP family intramembrane metalloprotease [Candidatus Dadabacteria bacterium]NIQ15412.1 CPBP family intramembrane metalloprotease [Candidatus Dadabacteria bacterium]